MDVRRETENYLNFVFLFYFLKVQLFFQNRTAIFDGVKMGSLFFGRENEELKISEGL